MSGNKERTERSVDWPKVAGVGLFAALAFKLAAAHPGWALLSLAGAAAIAHQ